MNRDWLGWQALTAFRLTNTFTLVYTDYWQCIWAHIRGLCLYDHEALANGYYALKPCLWAHIQSKICIARF